MRSRQIFYAQPEPGKKASNRYSNLLREFERHKLGAAGTTMAMGLGSALVLHLLRQKQLNDEIQNRNQKVEELGRMGAESAVHRGQSGYTSHSSVDSFIASVRGKMATELREQISASDALVLEMESENPGCSFVRDSSLLTAAFAAAMLIGIVCVKTLARREGLKAAEKCKKAEERPAPPETGTPAAHAAVAENGGGLSRPEYFDDLFEDLKKSIREEMGSLGSEEAAEAFLCVLPREDVEKLINSPEIIAEQIAIYRDRLAKFMLEKKMDPGRLFARLGPEVTELF